MHVLSEIDVIQHIGIDAATKGCPLSHITHQQFTYGEIGLLSLAWALEVCREACSPAQSLGVCYDLGSGSGRLLLFVALVTNMNRMCGIEYLPSLHKTSLGLLHEFNNHVLPELSMLPREVSFVQGDFLEHDWSDVDVLIACATCFHAIMGKIEAKASSELKPGSLCISITHRFQGDCWKEIASSDRHHSWGRGMVYVMQMEYNIPNSDASCEMQQSMSART